MKTKFEKPGTLPKAGPIGRTIRLSNGIAILYFFVLVLQNYTGIVRLREGWDIPTGIFFWLGAAWCFFLLPHMIDRGFTRTWGPWTQLVFIIIVLGAAAFDFWHYGSLWGPPLGLLVFLLMAYVFGHLGLSYIVAGIFATPG